MIDVRRGPRALRRDCVDEPLDICSREVTDRHLTGTYEDHGAGRAYVGTSLASPGLVAPGGYRGYSGDQVDSSHDQILDFVTRYCTRIISSRSNQSVVGAGPASEVLDPSAPSFLVEPAGDHMPASAGRSPLSSRCESRDHSLPEACLDRRAVSFLRAVGLSAQPERPVLEVERRDEASDDALRKSFEGIPGEHELGAGLGVVPVLAPGAGRA